MGHEKILEAKLQIKQSRFHGMVHQIAEITGLTTRTVRNHLRADYPQTSTTSEILRVAEALIRDRKQAQQKRMQKLLKRKEVPA